MEMELEKFRQALSLYSPIPEEQWPILESRCELETHKKDTRLVSLGDNPNRIYFVLDGILKTTYLNSNGQEVTKGFGWSGRIAAPYASMLMQKPSNIGIKTLTPVKLISVSSDFAFSLYNTHVCWQILGRKIAEALLVEHEVREYQMLVLDTEARYLAFLEEYKTLIGRIPQYEIASYIGITPVALSNLRKRMRESQEGAESAESPE